VTIGAVADELETARRAHRPFLASEDGLCAYDDRVPDLTAEAEDAYRAALGRVVQRARGLDEAGLTLAESVTRDVVLDAAERELTLLDSGGLEHTVAPAMAEGPSALLTVASRTVLRTPQDATAYLARCRAMPAYLQAHVARLQEGARHDRRPVAALVQAATRQVDEALASGSDAFSAVPPPPGWAGAAAWQQEVARAGDATARALVGWCVAVSALAVRGDDACGLCHLPGGADDYAALVRAHTTLDVTPAEVHALGRTQVEALHDAVVELGGELGHAGLDATMEAVLASGADVGPDAAMAACRAAIARAQDVLAQWIPAPIPPACDVVAMPAHLAAAGHAPHYTPPRLDGSPGLFWFNTQVPQTGAGWAGEALAFHEASPGHHLQLGRSQALSGLPALQRHGFVNAYGEGWALYAERLADEADLYSTPEMRLGALVLQLFRAARLVVDTGIHAEGWGWAQAAAWLRQTVPLPAAFAEAEIGRYVAAPGQALSYAVGQHELLRLRADAQRRLGSRFRPRAFHAAVLDSGSVPLATVGRLVDAWVAAC
jgi:uncharacterized protein (DUF885 family)